VGITERGLFTVGEMVASTVEHAREYTSQFHPRLGMVFTFEHMSLDQEPGADKFAHRPLHLPDLKKKLAHWQHGLAVEGWNSLYWENHDQPRVVSRFGDDSPAHRVACAKAWATVLHLHCGTPYIYQGEEIGMTNAGFTSLDQYRDIEALGYHAAATALGVPEGEVLRRLAIKGRDNARTPMPWTSGPGAGFTTGTPWLPLNADADGVNVEAAEAEPDGVLQHYRALVALRHEREVVRTGSFELLLPDDERLWVFTRTLGDERLLVLANLSPKTAGVPIGHLPNVAGARLVLGSGPSDGELQTLEPWEALVYELA